MKTIKRTWKGFNDHGCTDLAAGLTYYAVFAIFPALLALASLLSVVGQADTVYTTIVDVLRPLVSSKTLHDVEPTLRSLTQVKGAPIALAVGTAAALWSASGYVGAFGRAMNKIRDLEEDRPFWKLRPYMLLITLVATVLNAAALVIVVVSGPITDSIGEKIGVGHDARHYYEIGKWPVLALVVVVVVALLYRATPNEKMGFRLITPGAFIALLLWAAASTGFAFYVANFASYNKTYGSIAGVVVALLWLWLTNVALLFGAEIDIARERGNEARVAMAVAAGPIEPHPDDPAPVFAAPAVTSSRRRDRTRVTESFPWRPGEPPYGPITQPVPEED